MKITKKIFFYYGKLVTFSKVVKRELQTLTPMPLSARISMWSKGFFSASWYRYEFYTKKNNPKDYVSDVQENLKASRINAAKHTKYVDDKIIFPIFFGNFGPVVENFAFVNKGNLVPLSSNPIIDNHQKLLDLLISGQDLVIKPADGSRGGKVNKLFYRLEEGFVWNGKKVNEGFLIEEIKTLDFNIISPWIKQAKYANDFYPRTTNTVRVLTMVDPETNKAFIAHAVQRIGTKHSFPVDNFAVGGLTFNIDSQSGIIGKGSYIIPTESQKVWFSNHPETGTMIEGVQIPNWHVIKEKILDVANAVSFLKIIGWDLVVLDNSDFGFVLLEGNDSPCFKVHQLHGGFLKDDKILKTLKHYKIV